MSEMSQVDQAQFKQLLQEGKTPDEAAQILLQSRRTMAEACERLLEKLETEEGTAELQRMLEDLEGTDEQAR